MKLGVISVDLIANTVSFAQGMSKMSELSALTAKNAQRSLNLIGVTAAAMATSIVGSLSLAMNKAQDFAFEMQKSAMQVGTSSQMFSKLAENAKIAGVPMDSLRMSLMRLARTSGAAQSGIKTSVAAYAALGITVKDLKGPLKDSGDLFVAVSKSLDKFRDTTAKTALEQQLLGRSGAELAPVLKQVATGFDSASNAATLFGVVIGGNAAEQARKLHESLEELESISLGFSLRLLTGVSPALEDVASKIIAFSTSAHGMATVSKIAEDISKGIYALGDGFQFLTEHTSEFKAALEGVAALQVASIFLPLLSSAKSAGFVFDSLGLSIVRMVGRMSGVSALIPLLTSITATIKLQSFMIAGLVTEEGAVTAATYAWTTALNTLRAAIIANPIGLLVTGLALIATGFYKMSVAAMTSEIDGGKWADVWHAGMLGIKEDLNDVIKIFDLLTLDVADFSARKFHYTPFEGLVQQAGRDRRGVSDNEARLLAMPMLNATSLSKPKDDGKTDLAMPHIAAPVRVDSIKEKLKELTAAAKAAHQALAMAGQGVDFVRAGEVTMAQSKVVEALREEIDKLPKALRAAGTAELEAAQAKLESLTADEINTKANAEYRDELEKSTQSLLGQANAQQILSDAMGKGAEAVRAAQSAANAAQRDQGKSAIFTAGDSQGRAVNDAAAQALKDQANQTADKTTILNLAREANAQKVLNAAILQGTRAREDAAQANVEAAMVNAAHDRGDTDNVALTEQIALSRQLFEIKRQEADLQKVHDMDPAAVYKQESEDLARVTNAAIAAHEAISGMQLAAADQKNWDSYLNSIDSVNLAVGSAGQGVSTFFARMSRDTESAAQQVYDVLVKAFDSLNDTLVRLVAGQKASFAEMFRSISSDLAKLAIRKMEANVASRIMDAAGRSDSSHPKGGVQGLLEGVLGRKPADPIVVAQKTTNTILTETLDWIKSHSGSTMGGSLGGSVGSDALSAGMSMAAPTSASGAISDAANMIPFLSFLPGMGMLSAFGGHKALGGDVMAGVTYDVGEMGRERFTPSQNGRISPNNQMGNGAPTVHIDARGANDPAQVNAAVHRAMIQYGPHLIKASATSSNDRQRRLPSNGR